MIVRHILSILLLPTVVTIVVPYFILASRPAPPSIWPGADWLPVVIRLAGVLVLGLGLTLVGATIRQFATVGRGTLAPWDPPRRLVVAGIYRHVRNPMISGVLSVLLGEALAFQSLALLAWAAAFFLINAIYIPLFEEPGLARRFGEEYELYRRNVRRWIPSLRPWQPPWVTDADENAGRE